MAEPAAIWNELFESVGACKSAAGDRGDGLAVCKRLTVRENFFEPNPKTMDHWRSCSHQLYDGRIDRRVVFVCESPKRQRGTRVGPRQGICEERKSDSDPDFTVSGVKGFRTWDQYNRGGGAEIFLREREHAGGAFYPLRNSWITNVVKCGVASRKPDEAVYHCGAHFLLRELEWIQPDALICMGGSQNPEQKPSAKPSTRDWVESILRNQRLSYGSPLRVTAYHYSYLTYSSEAKLLANWRGVVSRVMEHLASLGRGDREVWMNLEERP